MSLVVLETVVVDVVVDVDVVVLSVVDVDTVVVVVVDVVVDVVDVVVVVLVTVVVEMVVVVVVDFSVVDKILKKSPRKGRSCVDPDPVEEGTSEEDAVLVITAASSLSLVVELTTLSMSNQVKSWLVPLLEVEASRLSVVLSYKAGFIERDSSDTTEPLLRIIEGISLSISNGNCKSKH